jgi:hypothetical protein
MWIGRLAVKHKLAVFQDLGQGAGAPESTSAFTYLSPDDTVV